MKRSMCAFLLVCGSLLAQDNFRAEQPLIDSAGDKALEDAIKNLNSSKLKSVDTQVFGQPDGRCFFIVTVRLNPDIDKRIQRELPKEPIDKMPVLKPGPTCAMSANK